MKQISMTVTVTGNHKNEDFQVKKGGECVIASGTIQSLPYDIASAKAFCNNSFMLIFSWHSSRKYILLWFK